jgi:hypothetical protein
MLRGILAGYAVEEVPMRLESRRFGESKLKVGDAVMAHGRLLLGTALMVGMRKARVMGGRMRFRNGQRARARPSARTTREHASMTVSGVAAELGKIA